MPLLPGGPEQQRKLLVAVLPLFLLFVYWQFYHGEMTALIMVQEGHLERLDADNAGAKARAVSVGPELEHELAAYQRHMARIERLIPTSDEVPQLLYDVTLRAQELGVDLTMVRPQPPQTGPYYTRHRYELNVRGGYHDVGGFLAAIGSLPRIVTATDLQLRASGEGAGEGGQDLDASFQIHTYVLPTPRRAGRAPDAGA